jgi:hypothetical protein
MCDVRSITTFHTEGFQHGVSSEGKSRQARHQRAIMLENGALAALWMPFTASRISTITAPAGTLPGR